eukprot:406296_1
MGTTTANTAMSKFEDENKTTIIFEDENKMTKCSWKISEVNKFKSLENGRYITSKTFKSEKNLNWKLLCYPNGDNKESIGNCQLYLYLSHMPKQYKTVIVYRYIHCEQTGSSCQSIQSYDKAVGWSFISSQFILLSELVSSRNISFECGIRILRIFDKSNFIIYQYPLLLSDIFQKQQIRWHINKQLMSKFKAAHWGQCFLCPVNDLFSITCFPSGYPLSNRDRGTVGIELQLCSFPIGVASFRFKLVIEIPQLDENFTVDDGVFILTYVTSTGQGIHFPSTKLHQISSMDIIAHIEILKCYNHKDEEIANISFKTLLLSEPYKDEEFDEKKYETDVDEYTCQLAKYYIHAARGLVLIICVKDYETHHTGFENLKYTNQNMVLLKTLFGNEFKYNVKCVTKDIVRHNDFDKLITEARNELYQNSSKYDVFIFAFSGHGNEDVIHLSDGCRYNRIELYKFFNGLNCKLFKDKPKLLIFDACKGMETAPQLKYAKGSLNVGNAPTHPDDNIIILNANSDEYLSFDTKEGGVLIKALYNVLMNCKKMISLDDLIKCIDIEMKNIGQKINAIQTLQCIQHGIKKQIFFCKPNVL